jgi:hypothetical protein
VETQRSDDACIPGLNPTVNLGASLTKETIYCRIILNRGGQCLWVKHILLAHAMSVGKAYLAGSWGRKLWVTNK